MPGKIFLIPSFLNEDSPAIIPQQVTEAVHALDEFIVENAKTARRFLRAIGYKKNFDTEVTLHEMDKHAKAVSFDALLKNVLEGKNCGIISEAGNPCIADPGNEIVAYAHKREIEVVPLVGPSSILLALISSGFSGQQFSFNGYLPIQGAERSRKIKQLESAAKNGHTQIFMETPFRNQKLLDEILKTCQDDTALCIACDLTLSTQYIRTRKVRDWKKAKPDLHKRYCIFLFG
ncbi:MAG: SAM-dependent methyltransferase [Bacteroidetes bacterium]|nr:SAM-dependent methyltransferase [Bacteroidota bacterium]